MAKPDIGMVLGLGAPAHGDEDDEDEKPSEEEIHDSKLAAANEMISAQRQGNADKLMEALDTYFDLCSQSDEEDEDHKDEDEDDEEEDAMRGGKEP